MAAKQATGFAVAVVQHTSSRWGWFKGSISILTNSLATFPDGPNFDVLHRDAVGYYWYQLCEKMRRCRGFESFRKNTFAIFFVDGQQRVACLHECRVGIRVSSQPKCCCICQNLEGYRHHFDATNTCSSKILLVASAQAKNLKL